MLCQQTYTDTHTHAQTYMNQLLFTCVRLCVHMCGHHIILAIGDGATRFTFVSRHAFFWRHCGRTVRMGNTSQALAGLRTRTIHVKFTGGQRAGHSHTQPHAHTFTHETRRKRQTREQYSAINRDTQMAFDSVLCLAVFVVCGRVEEYRRANNYNWTRARQRTEEKKRSSSKQNTTHQSTERTETDCVECSFQPFMVWMDDNITEELTSSVSWLWTTGSGSTALSSWPWLAIFEWYTSNGQKVVRPNGRWAESTLGICYVISHSIWILRILKCWFSPECCNFPLKKCAIFLIIQVG